MAASSSQGEMDWQTPGDLIIYSLEDLKGSDFKKLKNKLSDFSYGDKHPIPRGKLENADCITTKDLLINTYGEEGALDVTIAVLILNGLLGPANDLQEKRTQNAKLKTTTTSNKLKEGMNWQTPGDLIIYSLEDLKGSDFKKFKNKLSDFSYGDKPPIPRGNLENADCITTKDLLIDTHGGEGALNVICEVLTLIGLMGPANDLQKRRTAIVTLKTITTSNRLEEWRKEYTKSMKEDFQRMKEYNARRGETVSLKDNYTNLQLIKGPQIMDEKMYEMFNSGKGNLRILDKKSDKYFPTTIQTLFEPDKDGFIPKIVVLQGPAGIGKTMTSRKIMLDWASGDLYQDKFEFVFHLSCRELNIITGPISLVGLLSRTCKLQCSDELVSILKDPGRKLLFIVDGFDELRWTLEKKSEVSHDIFEETHKDLLLQRLLRKQILKQSSLIITTRPLALENLYSFVDESRDVEVLGFSEENRREYIHNFFKTGDDADKALSIIKDNEILYTMCTVPIVCWIVCTVLKPQIKQDLGLLQSKTATSVYLLYLKGLIKYHCREQPANTCLKQLCALAKEGILNRKILFEMKDLNRHGLSLSEVESVFLSENLFHLDIDTQTCYSFIHLSVQEFLAALYYVLDDGSGNEEGTTGLGEGTSIPEICKGNSLSTMCKEHPYLTLAVRFLFGLLNEKDVKNFSMSTGINISVPAKQAMEEWFLGEWLLKDSHMRNTWSIHSIEAILCLYETQDKDIIKRIISYSSHLKLIDEWKGPLRIEKNCSKQLCYCLKTCESFQALSFTRLILEPKHLQMLSSLLHGCQELRFHHCYLTTSCCDNLRSLLITNRALTSLYLSGNKFKDSGIKLLWEGLRDPGCTLQELNMRGCGVTSLNCDDLRSVLISKLSLTRLDLSMNWLEDSGVKLLCEGLRDPDCTLQELKMENCAFTHLCCDDLRSLLMTNRSLTSLDLSWNRLMDSGMKILCEGLRDPGCTIQDLNIEFCDVTSLSCDDLRSVLIANQSLTKLDLSANFVGDSGIKLICEGLKHPDCTLQELSINVCEATLLCCADLCSAISTNGTLSTLETRFWIDEEISESDPRFEGLRRLGCTVEKRSLEITIKYRRPSLQK
ncbi:NACHT, LRR and PYD domains-containing protein 3-like isoform X2 [Aquarana catesbeiana]|uniref:NACHT, LRR and PYD domains-containing protein 3-like isoform X2 n=1 Tax=Aquarana catesbeiana TaxID=8400 RepID=UPI003CC9E89C